jgi:hypothetical protein
MRNLAPARALARRARQYLQLAIILVVIGFFLGAVGLFLYVVQLVPGPNVPWWYQATRTVLLIAGVVVALAGIGSALRALTRRAENDAALITGNFLAQQLDARYSFIRNINPPGVAYIDAVLVGPPGVLVFRTLDNDGVFANETANWLERKPNGEWMPARINPTREVVDDIQLVRNFLARRNLADVPVYGIVVFTKDAPLVSVTAKEPVVPITLLPSIITNLGNNYLAKERIPQEMVNAVVRLILDE